MFDQRLLTRAARHQAMLNWGFAGLTLAVYIGFAALMVFIPTELSEPVAAGSKITVAIALGYATIVLTVALTACYVWLYHHYVEPLMAGLRATRHV